MTYYYIRAYGPVGNTVLWWRSGGHGYTTDLKDAGIFDENFALNQQKERPDIDEAWPVEQVVPLAKLQVDIQDLRALKR